LSINLSKSVYKGQSTKINQKKSVVNVSQPKSINKNQSSNIINKNQSMRIKSSISIIETYYVKAMYKNQVIKINLQKKNLKKSSTNISP
jgi:hypothetical protein